MNSQRQFEWVFAKRSEVPWHIGWISFLRLIREFGRWMKVVEGGCSWMKAKKILSGRFEFEWMGLTPDNG
jgi:hypothetical protein